MAYVKKTWKNRQVEYPGRRKLTPTGTADIYDVTREEGLEIEAGDPLNAANLNDLESRVGDGIAATVPNTRTVNDKALSDDITLTAADVGALGGNEKAADSSKWDGLAVWQGTQAAYDALTTKEAATIYVIVG